MKIGNRLLGAWRQRLPKMPNAGMTDQQLEDGQSLWSRRAIRSAIVLALILVFDAVVIYRYSAGQPPWETRLLVAAEIGLAITVAGEIIGDLMAEGFRAIAEDRSRERLREAIERATEAQLGLERLRRYIGVRWVDSAVFLEAVRGKPRARVNILFSKQTPECIAAALSILTALRAADWDTESGVTALPDDPDSSWAANGIAILAPDIPDDAASALASALQEALGDQHAVVMSRGETVPNGELRVHVHPKLI